MSDKRDERKTLTLVDSYAGKYPAFFGQEGEISPMKPRSDDPLDRLKENGPSSMSDKLFDKLRRLIVSGELPAGYTFPNENILCEKLSVGRSTLREAYKTLAAFGFVTRTKAGTIVNDVDTIVSTAPLGMAAEMCTPGDLAEFRLMLEMEIARYAAMRATEEDLAEMEAVVAEGRKQAGNIAQLARCDIQFHMLVARASHNVLLRSAMMTCSDLYETGVSRNYYRLMMKEPAVIDDSFDQHAAVLQAIREHDPAKARRCMREHIQRVYGTTQGESDSTSQKEVIP